jgi:sugar phosphate isomerase/epimerase
MSATSVRWARIEADGDFGRLGSNTSRTRGGIALRLVTIMIGLAGFVRAAIPDYALFAMDNGVGRGTWSPERQAATLSELGYAGISYNYTNPADLKAWLTELGKKRLRLFGLYIPVRLYREPALPDGATEAIALLRGSDAVLWLIIPAAGRPGDHAAEAVNRVREVADLAAAAGLRVVLYPHKGFHLATAEQALPLLRAVDRPNVGLTVNLAHELAAGNGARLPEIIRLVAPNLEMVSLNGATDAPAPGWSNHIKLLGTGTYDVAVLIRTLGDVGYRGPVGLQFYNVPGDPQENLAASIRSWRKLVPAVQPRPQ